MIVDEIDVEHVSILKPKNDAPVRPHSDRPVALQVSGKRVKAKGMDVDIFDGLGNVQQCENLSNSIPMLRVNSARIVALEEPLQAAMPEADNHVARVKSHLSNATKTIT
jgi:hypothetical protein